MDERSKGMLSLRKKKTTKRPQISSPKQITGPLPPGFKAPGSAPNRAEHSPSPSPSPSPAPAPAAPASGKDVRPRPRPSNGVSTEDLVKRRYSTRFTQVPDVNGAGAPPMPSVPSIPKQFANAPPSRDGRPVTGDPDRRIKIDANELRDPNLRADQYISRILADASESEIMNFQQELRKLKNRTSTDLQHNVYQNRTQFIKISKEAEKLKSEMRTLKTLMSELTDTLGHATNAGSGERQTARNRANRSSVANLEALWSSHLQTLWKRVEGSQKFLPAIPGRHIVHESGRWVELNTATWKARRKVHLILLNDHLLVASEKQRKDAAGPNARDAKQKPDRSPVQLIAQRCWPVQDVQIADLSARGTPGSKGEPKQSHTNAINIRVGTESFTYAVGGSAAGSDDKEKATLLSTFRRTVEELRKSQEAETEERGKAQDSVNYFAAKGLDLLKEPELLKSLSDATANQRHSMVVDVDGKQQNIRWIESQLDDLDIDIALQHFEQAVDKLESLKKLARGVKGNAVAQDLINFKVNERAGKLSALITRQLVETHHWTSATKKHVEWLVRLGYENEARESYLEARSAVITKRIRKCIFDGDLQQYIYQVSFIYFTIMKNTVQTYQNCFPPVMMSACIKWAKEELDDFNIILLRQLSSVDGSSEVWASCMGTAREHAGMLSEVGLDFREMIGRESGVMLLKGRPAETLVVGLGVST